MDAPLHGRLILVVEDEPVIAIDIREALRCAGASVAQARTVREALDKAEAPCLSAAVLDHRLSDGDTSPVCERLGVRGIPFVLYTGFDRVEGPCSAGGHVRKPVPPQRLVSALLEQLERREGHCTSRPGR
jgi:CheY-like chemotaxis protein